MPLIVRLGDTSSHGGNVVTSASRWKCEGALIARVGDLLACPLHGQQPIVTGSGKWSCEGEPIARDGDLTACGATLYSGALRWTCA